MTALDGKTHFVGDDCPGGHVQHTGGSFTAMSGVRGPCCINAKREACVCIEHYICKIHGETHIGTHD